MTQNRNTGPADSLHDRDHLLSTLNLHRLHPAFLDETPSTPHRLLYRDLEAHEWHVPDEQCVLRASTHSPAHRQQLLDCHGNRSIIAKHNHPVRITHENRIHNLIRNGSSRKVIRSNHHNWLLLSLPLEKVPDRELPLLSPVNLSQPFTLRPSR